MALTLFTDTFLVNADVYLGSSSAWNLASVEEREAALVSATDQLNTYCWGGSAVSAAQPLAWPRTAFSFFDPVLNLYVPVEQGEVPARVEKAVAKLALHYITYPEAVKGYDTQFTSIEVGPISLSSTGAAKAVPKVPAEVLSLVAPVAVGVAATSWWRAN